MLATRDDIAESMSVIALVSSTTDELPDTTSPQHRHSTEFLRLVLWYSVRSNTLR